MEKTGGGYEARRPRHSILHSAARAITVAGVIAVVGAAGVGCLTRKVDGSAPDTKVTFNSVVQQTGVDKIDLVFAIDNSLSMGDKQQYLSDAIPDLIARLVTPNCVGDDGNPIKPPATVDPSNGKCATGQPEFPPVHDMHIGIVSSSLGTRGELAADKKPTLGNVCQPYNIPLSTGTYDSHQDDLGHLINRIDVAGNPLGDAGSFDLLAWFPSVKENLDSTGKPKQPTPPGIKAITVATASPGTPALEPDLSSLVTGVGAFGCGIEAQLESWYRFLIQPDPYDKIVRTQNGNFVNATWQGVDKTILMQRSQFLRPDSLVAIINLTDENDSEIDVRAAAQTGWVFLTSSLLAYEFGTPPQLPVETKECDAVDNNGVQIGLNDKNCTSCGLIVGTDRAKVDPNCSKDKTDPAQGGVVASGGQYNSQLATNWYVDPNLVHVHMKAKYGFDPQYPLSRYVTGLTSKTVPNRDGEHPAGSFGYVEGNNNCTNPLFAVNLPDGSDLSADHLCHLQQGTARSANQIFYAIIGGVPHQDLPQPGSSDPINWQKILGKDPEHGDYTGIDAHMIESVAPRNGLAGVGDTSNGGNGSDAINGREWTTVSKGGGSDGRANGHILSVDLQYACTFQLPQARDCTVGDNQPACDCPYIDPTKYSLTPDEVPPLCAKPAGSNVPTQQIKAKAYPTIRELLLAKDLGDQGIAASICPIEVSDKSSPVYGYRPAVNNIVDRLKSALAGKCLPQPLDVAQDGTVPCLILELLTGGDQATACKVPGLSDPDAVTLSRYRDQQKAQGNLKDGDPALSLPLCVVNELTGNKLINGSCENSPDPGWCYLTRDKSADKRCAQSIKFSPSGNPKTGTVVSLQCIETAPGTGQNPGAPADAGGGG